MITGASGGLGAATARALAQNGFDLVQMLRSDCADIAAETGRLGISCSVLSDADVTRSVKTAMDSFGRIDAAVFGAGRHSEIMQAQEVPPPPAASKDCFDYDPHYTRDFFDIPCAAWRDDYDMMVLAPMRLAKAVLPLMRAARSGSFVAISGIEAGQPRLPFPLGPTRLALQDFIKLVADRYGPEGLRFNSIAPGLMESASAEFHPGWQDMVPLGRVDLNTEVGDSIAFLCSEAAS